SGRGRVGEKGRSPGGAAALKKKEKKLRGRVAWSDSGVPRSIARRRRRAPGRTCLRGGPESMRREGAQVITTWNASRSEVVPACVVLSDASLFVALHCSTCPGGLCI